MSGRKTFTAGEVLQAADVNDFLMDQSVMVFAGTAARGSAIPSPTEGMVTYREDDDTVEVFDGSAFVPVGASPAILQVVSTTKTDVFSTTSTSFADITGLSATITPSSASSKILVLPAVVGANGGGAVGAFRLVRDSTTISGSTVVGSRSEGYFTVAGDPLLAHTPFLDSPNTTSAITYKLQMLTSGTIVYVNRSFSTDNDAFWNVRAVSSITLMEVAG